MFRYIVMMTVMVGFAAAASAQEAAPAEEAPLPHKEGPLLVDLGDGLEVDLPAGMWLYERAEARAMLEAVGENADGVLAIIHRRDEDSTWSMGLYLEDVGHVSDADANELDAASLLAAMTEGTLMQNKVRVSKGFPEVFVDGWAETPSYDAARRVLSWTVRLHDDDEPFLNAMTNVLGRRGYVVVSLATPPEDLEANRADAAAVIAGVRYQPGHRYEDFDPSVDKSSGLGLRELVVGGGVIAAVKAGKVGFIAKLLLAFKKFFIIIGLALAGAFKWLHARLTGRRAEADTQL